MQFRAAIDNLIIMMRKAHQYIFMVHKQLNADASSGGTGGGVLGTRPPVQILSLSRRFQQNVTK